MSPPLHFISPECTLPYFMRGELGLDHGILLHVRCGE